MSSEASSFHVLVNCSCSGNVKVAVTGWWSDMNIGLSVALERYGRCFCMMNK